MHFKKKPLCGSYDEFENNWEIYLKLQNWFPLVNKLSTLFHQHLGAHPEMFTPKSNIIFYLTQHRPSPSPLQTLGKSPYSSDELLFSSPPRVVKKLAALSVAGVCFSQWCVHFFSASNLVKLAVWIQQQWEHLHRRNWQRPQRWLF